MKALIICSVHALCDFAELERTACNSACVQNGLPINLSPVDYAQVTTDAPILDLLGSLAGSAQQKRTLIDSYIGILNDETWGTALRAHPSVHDALLDAPRYSRRTGFVSEYPMLSTNLIRSSALQTNATRLGTLTVHSDPMRPHDPTVALVTTAAALDIASRDIEVLVSCDRDFATAEALGMKPRLVPELTKSEAPKPRRHVSKPYRSKGPILDSVPMPDAFARCA